MNEEELSANTSLSKGGVQCQLEEGDSNKNWVTHSHSDYLINLQYDMGLNYTIIDYMESYYLSHDHVGHSPKPVNQN